MRGVVVHVLSSCNCRQGRHTHPEWCRQLSPAQAMLPSRLPVLHRKLASPKKSGLRSQQLSLPIVHLPLRLRNALTLPRRGAAAAWRLALDHPRRVSRLAVISVGHPGEWRLAVTLSAIANLV